MSTIVYTASPAAVAELLTGGGEFLPPRRLLADLSEDQATAVTPGQPYSIAQVLAHMHFWQERQNARARGEDPPRPEHLDDTFAPPPAGAWADLVTQFLVGTEESAQLAAQAETRTSPDRDDTDVSYDLAESALHNAYHLGQVALLRQTLGFWPPDGGDESW